METIDFSKYTDAEKIALAEQLWDSVSKDDIKIGKITESIMMKRLERIEDGSADFYSFEEVREKIIRLRKEMDE